MGETARARSFAVAILPFATLSDDGKPDPFADALVDNLTTDLAIGFPSSTVISSASTFTYRGKAVDPRQAARELGAKYLLTGTLQKTADHLRINTHLIDGETDAQLWSEEFDGSLGDIASFRDQVTHGIANTLSIQLDPHRGDSSEVHDERIRARPDVPGHVHHDLRPQGGFGRRCRSRLARGA